MNAGAPAPKDPAEDLYLKAREYIEKQNYDEALALLEQSTDLNPLAKAYHDIAAIHVLKGNTALAFENFYTAIDTDPEFHQAYANLSKLSYVSGDLTKALKYIAMATRINQENIAYKDIMI
jgi:rhomboid protease GluP